MPGPGSGKPKQVGRGQRDQSGFDQQQQPRRASRPQDGARRGDADEGTRPISRRAIRRAPSNPGPPRYRVRPGCRSCSPRRRRSCPTRTRRRAERNRSRRHRRQSRQTARRAARRILLSPTSERLVRCSATLTGAGGLADRAVGRTLAGTEHEPSRPRRHDRCRLGGPRIDLAGHERRVARRGRGRARGARRRQPARRRARVPGAAAGGCING